MLITRCDMQEMIVSTNWPLRSLSTNSSETKISFSIMTCDFENGKRWTSKPCRKIGASGLWMIAPNKTSLLLLLLKLRVDVT